MGSLHYPAEVTSPNAPPSSGVLVEITVDADCNVTISGEADRGEVVNYEAEAAVAVYTGCQVTLAAECFNSGHADYGEWVNVGKPESWCYKYQCYGDADGKENGNILVGYSRVREEDLNILNSGWKVGGYTDPVSHPWIAADFDRTLNGNALVGYSRIREQDLNILNANWKDDSGIPLSSPNCGGDIDLTP
jgi:hypothetical protein